jgi:hypothetical protein
MICSRAHVVTIVPSLVLDATIGRFRTLAMSRFVWLRAMTRGPGKFVSPAAFATRLVRDICRIAGEPTIIDDSRVHLAADGVLDAIRRHDDAALFGWLMGVLSYQGVSDAIAYDYMERHGRVTAGEIAAGLNSEGLCPKLTSYWHFEACGYLKSAQTCSVPDHLPSCPLPRHSLRNGRLNQTAYSLFLFLRDVTGGDFVTWLDRRLAKADEPNNPNRSRLLAASVVEPLTHVYGVSHKVLTMSLSMLLLAGDPDRERWQAAGAAMIAIDTLVHNWLHRTGILRRYRAQHLYGPHCYAEDGCADIVRRISRRIDARTFNPDFPRNFPRFVQHAIWRFCSQTGLDECNGNRIDDRARCDRRDCILYDRCGRIVLRKLKAPAAAN